MMKMVSELAPCVTFLDTNPGLIPVHVEVKARRNENGFTRI